MTDHINEKQQKNTNFIITYTKPQKKIIWFLYFFLDLSSDFFLEALSLAWPHFKQWAFTEKKVSPETQQEPGLFRLRSYWKLSSACWVQTLGGGGIFTNQNKVRVIIPILQMALEEALHPCSRLCRRPVARPGLRVTLHVPSHPPSLSASQKKA